MEKALALWLITAAFVAVNGQTTRTCRSCSQSNFVGEPYLSNDCYDNVGNVFTITCPTTSAPYCYSDFTIQDGLVTGVQRGCRDAASDPVTTSTSAPTSTKCSTTFNNAVESTTCQYSCTTNNCNTLSTNDLQVCANNCSQFLSQGNCDYFTGTCMCNSGFTGSDCSTAITTTPAYRSCVQCDQEVDSTCATQTTGSTCPLTTQDYCTSTHTTLFDANENVVRTRVVRGCATELNYRDECFFSTPADSQYSTYNEYTCVSTCATDNCNTATPNGLLDGSEVTALYCLQCTDTIDSGACATSTMSRTLCPAASTHCYSTATYYSSNRTDLAYNYALPEYKFISIERGCGTSQLTQECTTTQLGTTSAYKTVCQESCQFDGCNSGWPNRPLCIQCTSATTPDGYDECLFDPPAATHCSLPYMSRCFYNDVGKAGDLTGQILDGRQGYSRTITRGCAHVDIGTGCTDMTIDQTTYTECNKTCSVDGCNHGMNGSFRISYSSLLISLPAIFGFLTQRLF